MNGTIFEVESFGHDDNHIPRICYAIENHPNDSRVTIDPSGIVQTLSSRMGTGGNNTPFVLIAMPDEDFVMNSSGDGIAAPLDASYTKDKE